MRYLAESNCSTRFCRPLPNRSAKVPFVFLRCKDNTFSRTQQIFSVFFYHKLLLCHIHKFHHHQFKAIINHCYRIGIIKISHKNNNVQKTAFRSVKDGLSPSERPSFTRRKATFRDAKGDLSGSGWPSAGYAAAAMLLFVAVGLPVERALATVVIWRLFPSSGGRRGPTCQSCRARSVCLRRCSGRGSSRSRCRSRGCPSCRRRPVR